MATSNAERALYPFSTANADDIALDIIDPTGLFYTVMGIATRDDIILPDGFDVGHVWAAQNVIIQFNKASSDTGLVPTAFSESPSGLYPDTLFVPSQTMLTVKFQTLKICVTNVSGKVNTVVIQAITKWNTKALSRQIVKK